MIIFLVTVCIVQFYTLVLTGYSVNSIIIGTMSRSECHLIEKLPEISYGLIHVSLIKL